MGKVLLVQGFEDTKIEVMGLATPGTEPVILESLERIVIEGSRLFNELRRPVILNAPQTPEYSDILYAGHQGGDFLFVRQKADF